MPRDNDDRPRRSWSEIDKMRDGSRSAGNRGGGRGGVSKKGELRGQAAERYKAQLNSIFSGGGVPDEIMRNAPGLEGLGKTEGHERLDAVRKATSPKDIQKAVDALLAEQDLPREPDVLIKVLAHPRARGAEQALNKLLEYIEASGKPENARLFKTKLQTLKLTADDDDVSELCDKILPLL